MKIKILFTADDVYRGVDGDGITGSENRGISVLGPLVKTIFKEQVPRLVLEVKGFRLRLYKNVGTGGLIGPEV